MAAIFKLRRGTSATPTLTDGELFLNYTTGTIQFASGSNGNFVVSNLLPLDKSINGNIVLNGNITATNLTLSGNATIDGNITLGGTIILGDGTGSDQIVINASLSGSLIPDTDNEYDLGADDKKYKNLYVVSASIDNISLPGSRILSSSLGNYQDFDTFSGSLDNRFVILNSYTQSNNQRVNSIEVFTQSIDSRVNTLETTFSSSVDSRLVNLNLYTQSNDQRVNSIETFTQSADLRITDLETTSSDHENRIDTLETTFSSSVDTRLDSLEIFSSSQYQTDSSSFDLRLIDLESTSSDQEPRINSLEASQSFFDNTFSSSVDSRLDSLEIFSESLDTEFLNTNGDNVVSSSIQIDIEQTTNYTTFSSSLNSTDSGLDSRIITLETTFSSSVDLRIDDLETTGSDQESRLDELETTFSSSLDSRLNNLNLYTQSNDIRIDGIDLFTGSQETKNSTLGTYTSSVEQRINSIHSYTSSLKNAIDVSGTGTGSITTILGDLLVQGATTTINTNDLVIKDKLVAIASGSIDSSTADGGGFFISGANASILWNHSTQILDFNTKVSSSIGFKGDGSELQNVTASNVDFNNITDKPTLVSGSSQVSFTDITNKPTLFSGSSQVNADSITNFDSNVKDKLNTDGVISGSSQISFLGIVDKPTLVSGSSQINISGSSDYIESIKTRLNSEGVISSSIQVDADTITNFDSNVRDVIIEDDVHSGSYLGTATTSDLDEGFKLYFTDERVKDKLNIEGVISGSFQLTGSFLQINGDSVVSSSQQISAYNIFAELNGDNLVSGSSQITASLVTGFSDFSSSVDFRIESLNSYTQSTDLRLNFLESTGSDHESRINLLELDTHTHSNKSNLDTIDQNLSISDSPTFNSLTLSNLREEPTSSVLLQGLLYTSSGEIVYADFGDVIYYNVSQSIGFEDDEVIGTAGAMKRYIDEQFLLIGAGDITEVNAGDGLSGGALSGSATLTLATSSQHFTDGVVSSLPNGIISGSTFTTFSSSVETRLVDLENFSSSLDDDFVTQGKLASATGSLINLINEKLDTGSYNTDSQSFDSRTNSLESFSSSIDTTIKTKLNTEVVISGSTGDQLTGSFDTRYLNTNGDGVVSGSSQIIISDTTGYTTFSSSIDSRLVTQESFSSSIDGTIKTKLTSEGVISGSSQLTTEFDSRYLNTNGDNVVSSSSQIQLIKTDSGSFTTNMVDEDTNLYYTDVRVKTKLNTDGVISGSSQISFIDITDKPTLVSGSDQLTGSLVDLVSDQNIGGTKTFNNIVVNGTGSFSFIQSTTGSSTSIGEAFIVLNENTPSSNFAGIKVVDSGSLFTTASFIYDGQNNQWLFQHEGSEKSGSSLAIFGPLSQDGLGTEVGLTENKIPKAVTDHGHHIGDSNITDTGTLITLGSNSVVNGTFYATGTTLVSGSSQITYSGISSIPAGIVSGSTQVTPLLPSGVVSGSGQVVLQSADKTGFTGATSITTLGTITTGTWNGSVIGSTFLDADTAHLSGTQTFSGAKTFSNSTASTTTTTGAVIVTGGVGIGGTLNVGGDVVAFASSDRRLKDEITPIPNSLQKINSIGGYSFVWNEKQDIYNGKDYGVIAQEIEEILPELVETRENGYKAVKYDRLVSLLIEGIKELTQEVAELKRKLED